MSILVRVINSMQIFTISYYFITFESIKSFFFLFKYLKNLIFYNKCPYPGVILGDFVARFIAGMLKKALKH